MSSSTLRSIASSDRFAASTSSLLLVDSNFRVRGANGEYLAMSDRSLDQLHGVEVFEAFPDNPADSFADGISSLTMSFERVMQTKSRDAMPTQRYDVRDERGSGLFVTRYWNTVNSSVTDDDGRVIGVLHRVYEVSRPQARQSSSVPDVLARLRAENDELRRALDSRPVIEQAKGLLMAERECSADQAFDLLVEMSQEWNVKVRDIAGGLVAAAERRAGGLVAAAERRAVDQKNS
ncbi:ANTAR domain-containing protein [Rhodococcus sp. NPDC057135]|uniref:ANTAR domain-containing protein n=1 Tax=Rhodococcus sp. NPDC057135 TaxID=3346028 RepID=UPI0036437579